MTPTEVAEHVAHALNRAGIPYIYVGSFSSNQYGIPRSTKDIDIVVEMPASALEDLNSALGSKFIPEAQIRFETNTGTMCQEFSVVGSAMKVEIFILSSDAHDRERFARRVEVPLFGTNVSFPTAEDVIVWKLRWARPKDLDDIRGVVLVQSREASLDWGYIRDWCKQHETSERLHDLIETLPEKPVGWTNAAD